MVYTEWAHGVMVHAFPTSLTRGPQLHDQAPQEARGLISDGMRPHAAHNRPPPCMVHAATVQ